MSEREKPCFIFHLQAGRKDSFGQILVVHLACGSWDRLRISTERGGAVAELRYSGHLIIRFGKIFQLCPVRTPAFFLV